MRVVQGAMHPLILHVRHAILARRQPRFSGGLCSVESRRRNRLITLNSNEMLVGFRVSLAVLYVVVWNYT